MDQKKDDSQNAMKTANKKVQSGATKAEVETEGKPERRLPDPNAVDRPGFDLGGSTGNTTAGTGLGLGEDAGESRSDRSLPGRHAGATLSIPRWSGPTAHGPPASAKDKASGLKNQ